MDIRGIGFKTADILAQKLGIAKESMIRAQAGVRHVVQEHCDHGHCAVERQTLIKASHELLEIPVSILEEAIEHEVAEKKFGERQKLKRKSVSTQ